MTLCMNFEDLSVHKHMLGDRLRCLRFRRALFDLIKPGSTVLDVGAGTGLLSIFAAQAGARIVYAVERTNIAELARTIVAENGFAECVQVIQEDIADVVLPEPVDVVVSEFLGGCGLEENMLPAVILARDRWLKPSGHLIPSRVAVWLAPAYDDLLESDVRFWNARPYGVDLSCLGARTLLQVQPCRYNVLPQHILCAPQQLWDVDLNSISHEVSLQSFDASVRFVFQQSGRCNALAAWFEADLSKDNVLSNNPSLDYTHWGRWVMPIGSTLSVVTGEEMYVHFTIQPEQVGRSTARWHVQVGDYAFTSEDSTNGTLRTATPSNCPLD